MKRVAVCLAFVVCLSASADTFYVSLLGSHTPPFDSGDAAATNIQDAVDAASPGDVVLVNNGTYILSSEITVTNDVSIESLDGAAGTMIDGQNAVRGLFLDGSSRIDGFTITHCAASNGAAVYLDGGGTVQDCIISTNGVGINGRGAGIYFDQGGFATNCTLVGNYAGQAGAGGSGVAFNQGGEVWNSSILDGTGPGVLFDDGGLVQNCIVSNNLSGGNGGGVYSLGGGTLRNCLITGNHANYSYAGVYASSATVIENCTIAGNIAAGTCGGMRPFGATVRNTIIYGNSAATAPVDIAGVLSTVEYSCAPELTTGTGNITNNPQFVDADAGNYRLFQTSPCRDVGTNAAVSSATDLDGNPRIANTTVDMGAYEYIAGEHGGDSPIHYVSTNSPSPSWPYTNWITASRTIQDAVDAASAGDTVLVTNGTYTSASEITVPKAITVESVNGPDYTIVDGQDAHRCFNLGNSACTLSGFTIQNGNAGSYDGGGIHCDGTVPLITNCTLSGNSAYHGGGSYRGKLTYCTLSGNSVTGTYADGGGSYQGTLSHCTLTGNSAYHGGGGSRASTLNSCTLTGNSADYGGGSRGGTLTHCTLTGNSATYGGGSRASTLNSCTLTGNSAADGGGSSDGTLNHCMLTGNSADYGGGSSDGTLKNCIVWNNTATTSGNNWYDDSTPRITWSCTTPDPDATGNNITNAPLFADAAGRLLPGSPCIDAGDPSTGSGQADLDGTPCPLDGDANGSAIPDMGAYEYINASADSDSDGLNDGAELNTYHSNPTLTDSDGDGRSDGDEVAMGYSPAFDESGVLADGRAEVTGAPASYGLYTADSISDLDMGYMMLQTSNGWMRMSLQLEQCTNLTEGVWQPAGDPKLWEVEATNGKAFFRVRGRE